MKNTARKTADVCICLMRHIRPAQCDRSMSRHRRRIRHIRPQPELEDFPESSDIEPYDLLSRSRNFLPSFAKRSSNAAGLKSGPSYCLSLASTLSKPM